MSISSTGLYGSATIVNSDLFNDVESLTANHYLCVCGSYICVYICMHRSDTFMCVCTYIHTCTRITCLHIHIYVLKHIRMYTRMD